MAATCLFSVSVGLSASVQFSSVTQSCPTLCDPMNRSTPGLPVHHQLPEFTQTHVHRVSDAMSHLNFCCPLLLLPPIPPSIRVFSNESTLRMRWPKYWSFSFSVSWFTCFVFYIPHIREIRWYLTLSDSFHLVLCCRSIHVVNGKFSLFG